MLGAITGMFSRGGATRESRLAEITAMCALRDQLVIGFSNGVLILLDTDKLEIGFSHKQFTKAGKPIDKLKINNCGDVVNQGSSPDSLTILFSLSDGLLSYHHFPKITLIDELIMEPNVLDFQPYSQPGKSSKRSFLATVHKNREIKIFMLRVLKEQQLDYRYVTKFTLDQVPQSFIVYRDIFVITYQTHLEYVRIDNKGKDAETITRINPLLWHQQDSTERESIAMPVFDESIQAFIITKDDTSFYMDVKGVYDHQFNKIKWSDRVLKVFIVRPYLVGFLPKSIEFKCIFNPNRVVQKVELLQSQVMRQTVAWNVRELDSLYVLLARKNTNIKVLMKCT